MTCLGLSRCWLSRRRCLAFQACMLRIASRAGGCRNGKSLPWSLESDTRYQTNKLRNGKGRNTVESDDYLICSIEQADYSAYIYAEVGTFPLTYTGMRGGPDLPSTSASPIHFELCAVFRSSDTYYLTGTEDV